MRRCGVSNCSRRPCRSLPSGVVRLSQALCSSPAATLPPPPTPTLCKPHIPPLPTIIAAGSTQTWPVSTDPCLQIASKYRTGRLENHANRTSRSAIIRALYGTYPIFSHSRPARITDCWISERISRHPLAPRSRRVAGALTSTASACNRHLITRPFFRSDIGSLAL